METISLKAFVDKKSNRVAFVESDEFFVDILFSFLTMPTGTIIRLLSSLSPQNGIGCMNNLYKSVENTDVMYFLTEVCKDMLLLPHNAAAAYCKSLKLKIDDSDALRSFSGRAMNRIVNLSCQAPSSSESDARNRGVFVKGLTRFLVSDNFQVMQASSLASISILTKLGVMDTDTIEERTFDIGVTEVLKLLQCSLVSKTPLTDVLLAREEFPELRIEDSLQRISLTHGILENQSERNGETSVRLVVCKSKKVVCYAEASKDFVDLLFSLLTIPLGYLMNGMHGGRSRGCISHLYNSVTDLDAKKYLKSNEIKEILLNPKIVPGSGYKNSFSEHAIKTKYESSKTSFPISTMNGMLEIIPCYPLLLFHTPVKIRTITVSSNCNIGMMF
ncbi:DUF674 FAMILY PROTEIN [Salix purpurea]|uniref:DUF674 FAMILY PROTEIN n=1 Tax=Salix purpurea TaxID=77065 RepID=A0A9Q0VUQ3_SALPP|nr:DUF674 FAMILY PROTEIN [Salix purpurea]